METDTIDRLFLELSQVTKAKTARETELETLVMRQADQARKLCHQIEECGASNALTTASIMASRLRMDLYVAAYPGTEEAEKLQRETERLIVERRATLDSENGGADAPGGGAKRSED